jgi:hypothetical protein
MVQKGKEGKTIHDRIKTKEWQKAAGIISL